ncbi:MAG: hypothetical protein QME94_03480 [Anaerolineae bacterium]|nr:hypothetical protein [Anaerolineae bacterium]
MTVRPSWLPDTVSTDGEWKEVVQRLYEVFYKDFHVDGCRFRTLEVWWDRRKEPGDIYEEGFWHLITRHDTTRGERLLDPPRARRISWCKPTLVNSSDDAVAVWERKQTAGKRRGEIRTYVWLKDFDYLVVVEKRMLKERIVGGRKFPARVIAFLLTAFHVGEDWYRKRLQRQLEESLS